MIPPPSSSLIYGLRVGVSLFTKTRRSCGRWWLSHSASLQHLPLKTARVASMQTRTELWLAEAAAVFKQEQKFPCFPRTVIPF